MNLIQNAIGILSFHFWTTCVRQHQHQQKNVEKLICFIWARHHISETRQTRLKSTLMNAWIIILIGWEEGRERLNQKSTAWISLLGLRVAIFWRQKRVPMNCWVIVSDNNLIKLCLCRMWTGRLNLEKICFEAWNELVQMHSKSILALRSYFVMPLLAHSPNDKCGSKYVT